MLLGPPARALWALLGALFALLVGMAQLCSTLASGPAYMLSQAQVAVMAVVDVMGAQLQALTAVLTMSWQALWAGLQVGGGGLSHGDCLPCGMW